MGIGSNVRTRAGQHVQITEKHRSVTTDCSGGGGPITNLQAGQRNSTVSKCGFVYSGLFLCQQSPSEVRVSLESTLVGAGIRALSGVESTSRSDEARWRQHSRCQVLQPRRSRCCRVAEGCPGDGVIRGTSLRKRGLSSAQGKARSVHRSPTKCGRGKIPTGLEPPSRSKEA